MCAADHLFGDESIGAVQIDVWMSNRGVLPPNGSRFAAGLVRMQDLEFRTAIAAIQMSRGMTGTISMGGNGQFTRLAALETIADAAGPWRGALLEDFELGVHLLTSGWRTGFTRDTHVAQEGLYNLRRFLSQRTRWGQGTMQCARYVRRIWDSPHLTTLGAAEMVYYLAQPWLQLLGTLVYPIPFLLLGDQGVRGRGAGVVVVFRWRVVVVRGVRVVRTATVPGVGTDLPRAVRAVGQRAAGVWYGFAYALYIYTFYVTSWRALFRLIRLIRKRNGWVKTRRNTGDLVALDR